MKIPDGKITSAFAKSALLVASAGILSRGIGFLREVAFANFFGSQEEFDVYLAGTVIPFIINTSVYYIAQNYLIPLFNSKSNTQTEQTEIVNQNFRFFIVIGLVLVILLFLLRNYVIDNYLWSSSNQIKQLAVNIFTITIFTIPLNAGFSVLASFYQSKLEFKYPSLLPVIQNIIVIVLIAAGNKLWGIYSIPIGYLLGNLVQFLTIVFLYGVRELFIGEFTFYRTGVGINRVLLTVISIEIINQLYLFIDRYFLNYIQPGGIAALNYSSVLFSLPINILSVSIAIITFPVFSDMIESEKYQILENYFYRIILIIFAVFILITLIYSFEGNKIIDLVYRRGKFTSKESEMVYAALKMYSVSLLFYAVFSVIYKMMFSLGLSRLLLIYTFGVFAVKILLNILLVKELDYTGLALSSSISYIIITICCYLTVIRKLKLQMKNVYVE